MSTIKVDTIATRTGSGNITASNTIAGNLTGNVTGNLTGNSTVGGTLGVTGLITASGGVSIGSGGSSNVIDDYEEGTFTPTIEDPDGSGAVSTYYYRAGKYTKIGNMVSVAITLSINSAGTLTASDDAVNITGLPYTFYQTSNSYTQTAPLTSFNTGTRDYTIGRCMVNTNRIEVRNLSGNGWNPVTGNQVQAGSQLLCNFTYFTDQ
tara:strand:+ start:374 stop:994 length:621 start_codon:yes stop_codon:yes gene_type:complete